MLIFGFLLLPLFLIIQLLMKERKNGHKPRTVVILHTLLYFSQVLLLPSNVYYMHFDQYQVLYSDCL